VERPCHAGGDQSATTEASRQCVRSEQRHRGCPATKRRTACSRLPSSIPPRHGTASTPGSRSPRPWPAPSGGGKPRWLSAPADRGGVRAGNCSVGWQPSSLARRHSHLGFYPRPNADHFLARTGATGHSTPSGARRGAPRRASGATDSPSKGRGGAAAGAARLSARPRNLCPTLDSDRRRVCRETQRRMAVASVDDRDH
jgi:hypothetical protein